MGIKDISPDQVVYWAWDWAHLNATIVFTWLVMALLVLGAWLATRRLDTGARVGRWQLFLETLVQIMRSQIGDITRQRPGPYLAFAGTLFLSIALSNLLAVVPGFEPPTASLSTTAALALCVFVAVPAYGITEQGLGEYLRMYVKPTPLMLPMNVLGELSRTLALAVRLFGNMMSGAKIAAILLAVTPLFFPVIMQVLGLLTGLIQAYIFAVLAMVYIASATRAREENDNAGDDADAGQGETADG